jgi:hypothetical protein
MASVMTDCQLEMPTSLWIFHLCLGGRRVTYTGYDLYVHKVCMYICEKFTKHMEEAIKNPSGKKKAHGKNLMPHELVQIYLNGVQTEMDLTLEAQSSPTPSHTGDRHGRTRVMQLSIIRSLWGCPQVNDENQWETLFARIKNEGFTH